MKYFIRSLIGAALALGLRGAAYCQVQNPPTPNPLPGSMGGTGSAMFTGATNWDAAHFPNWRLAIAKQISACQLAHVDFIGDSTDAGVNNTATVGATYTNARVTSAPFLFAKRLSGLGYAAIADNWFGDAGTTAHGSTPAAYYPQITQGSGWAASCTAGAVVGGCPIINSTTTSNLATTSLTSVDTAVVYYIVNAGGTGTFTTQVDSGTVSSAINAQGTQGIATTTVSLGTAGVHTLNLARVSGTIYIAGVEFYNSSLCQISVRNYGWGGSTSAYWTATGNAWLPSNQISTSTYGAALTFINLGINDSNPTNGISSSVFATNMAAIIAARQTKGDVVVQTFFPTSTSTISSTQAAPYLAAILNFTTSSSLGIPAADWNARMVNYNTAVAGGWTYTTDPYHPSIAGNADRADWLTSLIQVVR